MADEQRMASGLQQNAVHAAHMLQGIPVHGLERKAWPHQLAGFQAVHPVTALLAGMPEKYKVKHRVATPVVRVQPLGQEVLHSAWMLITLPHVGAHTPHHGQHIVTLSARMSVMG